MPSLAAPERFAPVDEALRAACGTRFTGAVARVEHRGRVLFERAYGTTRDDRFARPVFLDTRFDLASVGKVFVSTLALTLVQRGVLELDEPLAALVPEWAGTPREAVTLRMLLAHTGGFASGADFRTLFDRDVAEFAMTRDAVAPPGVRVVYSDLGFITLGRVLERATRRALPALVRDTFVRPTLGFSPKLSARAEIVATECDDWRGRVQGVVHDEKAYLMNGVAGHAGLFGTAADVAALARAYLDPLHGRPESWISASLAREAVREAAYDPVLRRGLGWALKTSDTNSCGRLFDETSFGHTGFVGTCVWSDPTRDLIGVLLTNTVYFGRSDSRDVRAAFYEGIVEAVHA